MRGKARRLLRPLALLLVSVALGGGAAFADDSPVGGAESADDQVEADSLEPNEASRDAAFDLLSRDQPDRQPAPDVYYLPDKEGELRRVLGFQYADFLRAWGLAQKAEQPFAPPPFVLQNIRIRGVERGDVVEVVYELDVIVLGESWTAIPLDLGAELVVEEVSFADADNRAANLIVSTDDEHSGLKLWSNGAPKKVQSATIRGLLPIRSRGEERTIELSVPRASAADLQFELSGDLIRANGAPEAGATLEKTGHATTIARLRGVAGPLQLFWRPSASPSANWDTAFEATAALEVDVAINQVEC
ncbi:hypothetical protein OAS39_11320, partial [Pirellulales bacterium]|nr:hypothetical protein [Pirellulales bacterium]